MVSQAFFFLTSKVSEVRTNSIPKSRIYLNLQYFTTGDINKKSGLEIEYLIDPGSTFTIIYHPTFLEILKTDPLHEVFLSDEYHKIL